VADPTKMYGRIDILTRAAEAATDINDKQCLTRLAASSEGYGKGDPAYWSAVLESKCKDWHNTSYKGTRRYFSMIEACLEMLRITHDGEWVHKDIKNGACKWVVSYRKFEFFRKKCRTLEAENAALKAAIHALTEGKK
jgi:hypothetical protein